MANRFSRPAFADTQIQSSFVPMPLDFLQGQIDRKQKTFDQREAEVMAVKDHWSKMQSLSADQEIMDQYTGKYDDYLKDNLDKVGGDYGKLSTSVAQSMMSDMQTGQVSSMTKNFTEAQKVIKEAKTSYDKGDMLAESYNRVLSSVENFGGTNPDGNGGFTNGDFYAGTRKVEIDKAAIDLVQKNGDKYDENGMKYKDIHELANSTYQSLQATPGLQAQLDDIMWANTPGWDQLDSGAKYDAKEKYLKSTAYKAADRYDYQQHKATESSKSQGPGSKEGVLAMIPFKVSSLQGTGLSKGTSSVGMFESAVGGWIVSNAFGNSVAGVVEGLENQAEDVKGDLKDGKLWDAAKGLHGLAKSALPTEMALHARAAHNEYSQRLLKQTKVIRKQSSSPYLLAVAGLNPDIQKHIDIIENTASSDMEVAVAAKEVDRLTKSLFKSETPRYNSLAAEDPDFVEDARRLTLSGKHPQVVLEGIGNAEYGEGLGAELKDALYNANASGDKIFSAINVDGPIAGTHSSYPAGSISTSIIFNSGTDEGRYYMEKLGLERGQNKLHIITMHGEYSDNNTAVRDANIEAVANSPHGMVVKYGRGADGTAQKQTWIVEGYAERKSPEGISTFVPMISRYANVGGSMTLIPEQYIQGNSVSQMPSYFTSRDTDKVKLTEKQKNDAFVNTYF